MAVYMVERELPGITPEQLAQAQEAAISTSSRFTQEGKPVRYIRSTFLPDDSRCFCLFEAPTRQLVRDVNDAAGLPVSRIVQALDLSPLLTFVVLVLSMLSAACGTNPLAPERVIGSAAVAHAVRPSYSGRGYTKGSRDCQLSGRRGEGGLTRFWSQAPLTADRRARARSLGPDQGPRARAAAAVGLGGRAA